ncbi:MAG: BBP7 family outer membrane beta-barrel protein, partial [Planctomycetota bacterium]
MRIQIRRSFAIAAGLSFCSIGAVAQAQESYKAPSKWRNFSSKKKTVPTLRQVSVFDELEHAAEELIPPGDAALDASAILPEPVVEHEPNYSTHTPAHNHAPAHSHAPAHTYAPAPMATSHPTMAAPAPCNSCGPSPYSAATSATWEGSCAPARRGPVPISPYFGGFDLLFWNVTSNNNQIFVADDATNGMIYEGDINPGASLGYRVNGGRYFGCGQWGLDVAYLSFDPERESREAFDGGGGLRLTLPVLRGVEIDRGGGLVTVYDDFDTNATRIRATRDLRVQGLEISLANFGLMGARRLGSCNPGGLFGGACRNGNYGNAIGPLARAAGGRSRFSMIQGFRWFQLEDELQFVGDVDGTAGYSGTDLYATMETENNLYGYQFGGLWSYCVSQRLLLNIGGKVGLYGNHARFRHSIGTSTIVANTVSQGAGAGDINTDYTDTVLAGLGELDLGLGYRLNCGWTLRGGYRILAASNVATAPGSIPNEYVTAASAGAVRADDSLVLHGAYIGAN